MQSFDEFNISKQLHYAITDFGYITPTPIQVKAFPVIASGKDVVGIAQTGTGKTFAYMLPILQNLKYSKELHPRVLILVPTRELVVQAVEEIEKFSKYINNRVIGVYGGTNINTQKQAIAELNYASAQQEIPAEKENLKVSHEAQRFLISTINIIARHSRTTNNKTFER